MANTLIKVYKQGATVNVTFTQKEIVELQKILLKHVTNTITLDTESWEALSTLCESIDRMADEQDQF